MLPHGIDLESCPTCFSATICFACATFCNFISLTKLFSCGFAAYLSGCFSGSDGEEEINEGGNDEE